MWTDSDYWLRLIAGVFGVCMLAIGTNYGLIERRDLEGFGACIAIAAFAAIIAFGAHLRLRRKAAHPPKRSADEPKPRDWMGNPLD